jgi:hypothetical protein
MLARRGFLFGLGSALIAAPALVRASSLDLTRGIILADDVARDAVLDTVLADTLAGPDISEIICRARDIRTVRLITQEAVRLWTNTNEFLEDFASQYDTAFAAEGAKLGQSIRIGGPLG